MTQDKLRDSESMEKVRETGGSGMIIGEILCLFLFQNCLYYLPPFPSTPCMVESPVNRGSRSKRNAKAGIVHHYILFPKPLYINNNNKVMPRSFLLL